MSKFMGMAVMASLWLCGCASLAPAQPGPAAEGAGQRAGTHRYQCDQGLAFTVRFARDTAEVDGPRGSDVLLRDAGGATPQQTVYSNTRMRAEFGLGASGREAMLRYAEPPLAAHCVQQ